MARHALIFIALLVSGCATGVHPVAQEDLSFNNVYQAPGVPQDEIIPAANIWVAENFRSAQDVVQHVDETTLIVKGNLPYPCKGFECVGRGNLRIGFTMRVDARDERFRVEFSQIELPINQQREYDRLRPVIEQQGHSLADHIIGGEDLGDW